MSRLKSFLVLLFLVTVGTLLSFSPIYPSVSGSFYPTSQVATISPSEVYTLESQNFYVKVTNVGSEAVFFVNVTVPSALDYVGFGQTPNWVGTQVTHGGNYTMSWIIRNLQFVLRRNDSATFAFSANVIESGVYPITVTEQHQNGSSDTSLVYVTAISPSALGLVDVRYLAYILAAVALLLPAGQLSFCDSLEGTTQIWGVEGGIPDGSHSRSGFYLVNSVDHLRSARNPLVSKVSEVFSGHGRTKLWETEHC